MAKKGGATSISHTGPTHDPTFEPGYESNPADDHFAWKTDIKAVVAAVPANPHEEVDEVHQGDADKRA